MTDSTSSSSKNKNNVHDKFFRASMGHQSVAIDFIQHNFPKKITQALNISTLKLLQQSFINKDLQEYCSDSKKAERTSTESSHILRLLALAIIARKVVMTLTGAKDE